MHANIFKTSFKRAQNRFLIRLMQEPKYVFVYLAIHSLHRSEIPNRHRPVYNGFFHGKRRKKNLKVNSLQIQYFHIKTSKNIKKIKKERE